MKKPIASPARGGKQTFPDVCGVLQTLRDEAKNGDPKAVIQLVQVALESVKHLEALSKEKNGLALLKMVAGHFEEFPTNFTNPLYIMHRSYADGFMRPSSGDNLRAALTILLPFKISAGTDTRKKRGKPKKEDLLNQTLQFFVRGVCCHAVPDSLAIWERVSKARGTAGAWAKEFVDWMKAHWPDEVEKSSGSFHGLAVHRLTKKRESQLGNKNGRSYDGANLWPQFQHVVTRRLGSVL